MTLKIEIEMDNDAFMPLPAYEASRILKEVQRAIMNDDLNKVGTVCVCRDANGNTVGKVEVIS